MFKNLIVMKLCDDGAEGFSTIDLVSEAEAYPSEDPPKVAWHSLGFVQPECFGESLIFEGALGAKVMCIQKRERVLPGSVIDEALQERIKLFESREGRLPNRKDIAGLKDEVKAKLLPDAFVKPTRMFVMYKDGYLLFDSSSNKAVEEVTSFLRRVYGEYFPINGVILQSEHARDWMRDIAINDLPDDSEGDTSKRQTTFYHLDAASFKGDGVLRIKDLDFDAEAVQAALGSGMRITELSMGWGKETSRTDLKFSVNENLVFKRIKFSDIQLRQAREESDDENAASYFDASVAIMADLFMRLITDVSKVMAKAEKEAKQESAEGDSGELDSLLGQAAEFATGYEDGVTISGIQKHCRVGYNRAANLMEKLRELDIVDQPDHTGRCLPLVGYSKAMLLVNDAILENARSKTKKLFDDNGITLQQKPDQDLAKMIADFDKEEDDDEL